MELVSPVRRRFEAKRIFGAEVIQARGRGRPTFRGRSGEGDVIGNGGDRRGIGSCPVQGILRGGRVASVSRLGGAAAGRPGYRVGVETCVSADAGARGGCLLRHTEVSGRGRCPFPAVFGLNIPSDQGEVGGGV